jgi:hypothetical protein
VYTGCFILLTKNCVTAQESGLTPGTAALAAGPLTLLLLTVLALSLLPVRLPLAFVMLLTKTLPLGALHTVGAEIVLDAPAVGLEAHTNPHARGHARVRRAARARRCAARPFARVLLALEPAYALRTDAIHGVMLAPSGGSGAALVRELWRGHVHAGPLGREPLVGAPQKIFGARI